MSTHYSQQTVSPPKPCRRAHNSPCIICTQISEVEREVLEAKKALERVLEKQRTLKAQFNSCHDAFICRLPLELANLIFEYCMPPIPTNGFGHGPRLSSDIAHRPRLNLGAVCRQWRQMIWSNPRFWNVVRLTITPNSPIYLSTVLQEWINRSGELPLFIFVYYSEFHLFQDPHSHPTDLLSSIITILNSCVHRWTAVNLRIPSSYMTMLVGDTPKSNLLKVLDLEIIADDTRAQSSIGGYDGKFNVSPVPQPEQLRLSHFLWKKVNIDLCNLISFEGDNMLPQDCLEVMRLAPHMVNCTFDSVNENGAPASISFPSAPLLHTSLERLRVQDSSHEILNHLICPRLWSLALSQVWKEAITDQLGEFVKRSNCSLQLFDVMMECQSSRDLVEFLKLTPSLRTLEVWDVGDEFFKHLGDTSQTAKGSEAFLPNLHTFNIMGPRSFRWSSVPLLVPVSQQQNTDFRRLLPSPGGRV